WACPWAPSSPGCPKAASTCARRPLGRPTGNEADMDDLDRDIHNAFHARQLPGAPTSLVRSLDALPRRQARPGSSAFRLVLGLAATLAVLVVAAVAVSIGSH